VFQLSTFSMQNTKGKKKAAEHTLKSLESIHTTEIQRLKQEIAAKEAEIVGAKEKLNAATAESFEKGFAAGKNYDKADSTGELSRLQDQLDRISRSLATKDSENSQLKLRQVEFDKRISRVGELESHITDLNSQLAILKGNLAHSEKHLRDSEATRTAERTELEQQLDALKRELVNKDKQAPVASLRPEITIYRNLLGAAIQATPSKRQKLDHNNGGTGQKQTPPSTPLSEVLQVVVYTEATSPLKFSDFDSSGATFFKIQNVSSQSMPLSGWYVKAEDSESSIYEFVLPATTTLQANEELTVYTRNARRQQEPSVPWTGSLTWLHPKGRISLIRRDNEEVVSHADFEELDESDNSAEPNNQTQTFAFGRK